MPITNDLAIAKAFISICNNKNDYSYNSKNRYNEKFKISIITEKIVNIYLNL